MDSEKISARVDFVERRQLDLQIARLFGRDERIVSDDQHAHRACARSDHASDAAQADDAECLSLKFDSDKFLAVPTSGFEAAAGLRDRTRERDQQRDRVFGGRDRVAVGRIHHDDAANRRGGNVDVVDADSRASDDAQAVGRVEQIRSDFGFAAHDQTFAVLQCFAQFGRRESGSFLNVETGGAQWSKTAFAHIIRHKNLCRHGRILPLNNSEVSVIYLLASRKVGMVTVLPECVELTANRRPGMEILVYRQRRAEDSKRT